MFDILQNTDLEDKKRITELMFQNFMGFQQSIVENGHRFAMLGAHRCTINFLMFKKIWVGLALLQVLLHISPNKMK